MEEHPFVGGNFSRARRVGDTVRRDAGPWTPTVHALLRHLRTQGFDAAPAPVAFDEREETLTYVEGETHAGWPDPMPAWVYDGEAPRSAARLLRAFHDGSAGFRPARPVWQVVAPTDHEVICHNDWAPYNAIFKGNAVVAMVDWDRCGPGDRTWDLAYAAFTWVPLSSGHEDVEVSEKAARLRRFCDAYGWDDPGAIVDRIPMQLRYYADEAEREARAGHPAWTKLVEWGVPERGRHDAERIARDARALKGGH